MLAVIAAIVCLPVAIFANSEAQVIVAFVYPGAAETPAPEEGTPSPSVSITPEETDAPPTPAEPATAPIATVRDTPDALPETLEAIINGGDGTETVEAVPVRWRSEDYQEGVQGEYRFEAVPDSNYEYSGSMPYAIVVVSQARIALRSLPETPWDGSSGTSFIGGQAGTAEDPYIIGSAAQLAYLAQAVNNGSHDSTGKYYSLSASLDLANHSWTPIGSAATKLLIAHTEADSPRSAGYRPFKGTFIGNGHTVYNLKVQAPWSSNRAESDYMGLFGLVEDATITGLNIETATIDGGAATGTLVGYAYGAVEISGCEINGANVSSKTVDNFGIGGLIGVYDIEETTKAHSLTIKDCSVSGLVITNTSAMSDKSSTILVNRTGMGGVLGMARAYLSTAANTGAAINISGCSAAGNMAFDNLGNTSKYSSGAGGIVGSVYMNNANQNAISIADISAEVNITARAYRIGFAGVLGSMESYGGANNSLSITKPVVNATIKGDGAYCKYKGGVLGLGYVNGGSRNEFYIEGGVDSDGNKLGSVGGSISSTGNYGFCTGGIVGGLETTGDYTKLTIKDIAVSATVSVQGTHSKQLGGGLGGFANTLGLENELVVDGVVTSGAVSATGAHTDSIGGVVGEADFATTTTLAEGAKMSLRNCYSSGAVSTTGGDGCWYAGGILGYFNASHRAKRVSGEITNCHSTGNVTASKYYVGGVLGFAYIYGDGSELDMESCSATGDMYGGSYYVGGFAGYLEITKKAAGETQSYIRVKNCYATGAAETGSYFAGGFVGHSHGGDSCPTDAIVYTNCWASGDVKTYYHAAGGFVGDAYKGNTFNNCYSTGDVSGSYSIGGFVGQNRSDTSSGAGQYINCYATGNVFGTGTSGGFAGDLAKSIVKNCYAVGSVNGSSSSGGFIGTSIANNSFTNCFASGTVDNGKGFSNSKPGTFTNCFFDTTTTMQTDGGGTGITGVSTEHMLEAATFTGWDALNVWHVSLSAGQRNAGSPWYIDEGATYPYLYYQADGFDTDGDGLGDGYFDPQQRMPADFESTNYFMGELIYNDAAGENTANDKPLGQNRFDFSFSAAKSLSFKAMTIGAERAYFPYAYAAAATDYNAHTFWFADGSKNTDSDGSQWVSTFRSGKKAFTAGQKISFGSFSRTNIVAFTAGPGAVKTNDSPAWRRNTSSSYTFTGHKITYKTEFTNYSPVADWKGIGLSDPLAEGVTLVNDFVFLNKGGQSTHLKDYTAVAEKPKTQQQLDAEGNGETAEPYFTYEEGTGEYAGRYVLAVFNLPELEYAKIQGGSAVFDSMDVEFVTQVEEGALSSKYPSTSLTEAAYRAVDNIRNTGTVSGTMHYWDPAGLLGGTPVKTPLLDSSNNPLRVDVSLRIDDTDRDPVYSSWMVIYSSNYRSADSALADKVIDKDYFLSDNTRAHTVIPNDDLNDPADNPHLRKDYTNFADPSSRYRFDGWFYFKNAADEAAYEARSDAAQQPLPAAITEISMEQIANGYILDPAADAGLRGRSITLYARWKLRGPVFTFLKHDDAGQPLPGAQFDLYYWEGSTAPEAGDSYVYAGNTAAGKWVKQNAAPIESGSDGYVELTFPLTGHFQLVESSAPSGYYTPRVQWRFQADADSMPQQLTDPATIEPTAEEVPLIGFTSEEAGGETSWFLLNYLQGEELPLSLAFRKVDASDMTKPLPGVEFNLYRCAESHAHATTVTDALIAEGTCWLPLKDGEANRVFAADADGYVTLQGVRQCDYMLVESKAYEGYMRPVGQWMIELDMSKKGNERYTIIGRGEMLPPAFAYDDVADEYMLINLKSFPFVNSGAFGIARYIITGTLFIAAALGFLAISHRRARKNHRLE